MLIKQLLEEHDKFKAALADMVRDEDEPELSEAELKALVKKVSKAHGLNAAESRRLALAAEGPIGY